MLSAFLYLLNGRRKTEVKAKNNFMISHQAKFYTLKNAFFCLLTFFKVSLTLRNRIYCFLSLKNNESVCACESSLLTCNMYQSQKSYLQSLCLGKHLHRVDCFQCAIFSDISLWACRRYTVEHIFSPHLKPHENLAAADPGHFVWPWVTEVHRPFYIQNSSLKFFHLLQIIIIILLSPGLYLHYFSLQMSL